VNAYTQGSVLLDRFELVEKIGQGGMGQVWRAVDRELREDVALKMLATEFANDPICLRQLKDEVRRARKLGHPHIVRFYELFTIGVDAVFITMEFIPGKNVNHLRAMQTDMRFSEDQAMPWVRQISQALDYAHEQGIIHRDIKPSNILITNNGEAKLADFGIAVAMSDSMTRMTRNTSGTPAYMSPEQIQGKSLTAKSDLYSLGCTLYELLCGKAPYSSGSVDTVIRQHLEGALPIPAEWPVPLSPSTVKLLQALLQRNPEDRPTTAGAIIKFLDGDEKALNSILLPPKIPSATAAVKKELPKPSIDLAAVQKPLPVKENSRAPIGFLKIAALILLCLFLLVGGILGSLFVIGVPSKTNDEIFTPARFDSDYASWKKGLDRLKNKQGLTDPPWTVKPAPLSLKEKLFHMPSSGSVISSLNRRLPPGMRLISITPTALQHGLDGSTVNYNLELSADTALSLVPVENYTAPSRSTPIYKRLASNLIFDETLPAGSVYKVAQADVTIPAGQKITVPWTVRKAVKEGLTWKVLDAEPLPFERNSNFEYRNLRTSKTLNQALRTSEELAGAEERMRRLEEDLQSRLNAADQDAASYRQQIMVNAPAKPIFNPRAGDGGMATNTLVGTGIGAGAGAGLGAIAGGGDGAGLGAGIGAGVGLLGGFIKGSVEKDNRKKAYQAYYNNQMSDWRRTVGRLEADASAYRNKLIADIEKELKDRAKAHDNKLNQLVPQQPLG